MKVNNRIMQHQQNNNYIRKDIDSTQTQRKRHYFINYMWCVLKKYVTTLNELITTCTYIRYSRAWLSQQKTTINEFSIKVFNTKFNKRVQILAIMS